MLIRVIGVIIVLLGLVISSMLRKLIRVVIIMWWVSGFLIYRCVISGVNIGVV